MKALTLYPTSGISELAQTREQEGLSLQSAALQFFTDFETTKPLVIESSLTALEVKKVMHKAHVRLMFVIEDNQFIGIVSAEDLIDRKIVQKVSEGSKRNEISLSEVMQCRKNLKALDYQEVMGSKISEVIETLKGNGEQHCLVIDRETLEIRGMFSASDISRKLHLAIDIQKQSSFYKVFSTTDSVVRL